MGATTSGTRAVSWARTAVLLGSALLVACRAIPAEREAAADSASPSVIRRVAGSSVEGREIPYSVHGSGSVTVLLLAGIHGNEAAGTPLLERLEEELEAGRCADWLADRRLVVVPRANPDGLTSRRRHNARGVDLNRNFPSRNFSGRERHGAAPLSEPESRALHELVLRFDPDRALSFHMPVGIIDYDGPAEALARAVGAAGPLPVQRLGSRPGSLGSWFGVDLGRPILTVEQPGSDRVLDADELWERYAPMLRAAILFGD